MKKINKSAALLEIGVEELPARFIEPAITQLKTLFQEGLIQNGIEGAEINVLGTPRRLAVIMQNLPPKTTDRIETVIGPPPKAAQDPQGNWTQAAQGFAKNQNIKVEKLLLQATPKGDRYVAQHTLKGQNTELALKLLFPELISKIYFPKTMVWEKSRFRFARPIRWIVALFNSKVVRFQLAGINSDKTTFGLLALGGKKIPIPHALKYKEILKNRCIFVDPEDRKSRILAQLDHLAKKGKPPAKAIFTPEHLSEVVHLTEYPVSIRGHFEDKYLSLPREILITVLKKHQKFFPMESGEGEMLPSFIGVRNGPSDYQENVREGYERVTKARLADAQFFFDQDSQIPLDGLVSQLDGIGFLDGLGTMKDKTHRIVSLVEELGEKFDLNSDVLENSKKAAQLSKTDLLTQIVRELPELQGIAGRFYAIKNNPKPVANAIEQHYWPLTAEGELPAQVEGAIVSVADKLDTLAAHFALGNIPSGSQDPFALRRASLGMIRIILERQWPGTLSQLVQAGFRFLPPSQAGNLKAQGHLRQFLTQRCIHWMGSHGYRADEVEAVLADENQNLYWAIEKLEGLKAVRGRSEFEYLSSAIKRARNILIQAEQKGLLPKSENGLNETNLEKTEADLFLALKKAQPLIESALKEKKFEQAFLALAPLKDPVDAFFEGVMVMAEDEGLRNQRLNLLKSVQNLFDSVADFSKLQPVPSQ